MKWNLQLLSLGVLAALAFQFAQSARSADEDKPERPSCDFAVLDISQVFKSCDSFNAEMAAMKSAVEPVEAEIAEEKRMIMEREKEAEKIADPDESKEEQASLLREKTEFNIKMTAKRNEFLEQEAHIYLANHQRIQSIVEKYSKEHGIRLVIRVNSEQYKSPSREEILKMINAPIIFEDQVDITRDILALVNQKDMSTSQ
jgi:Skp family chaperone for outer membrane proteins